MVWDCMTDRSISISESHQLELLTTLQLCTHRCTDSNQSHSKTVKVYEKSHKENNIFKKEWNTGENIRNGLEDMN